MDNQMKKLSLIFITCLLASTANAALINLETRVLEFASISPDYLTSWNNHSSAITTTSLSGFTNVDTGNNIFAHLEISFDLGTVDSISFDFGLDAGYGAAVYVDGSLATQNDNNLWWAGNYNNALTTTIDPLALGTHTVDLYWGENGNSGGQSIRFTTDGGSTYQNLSTANLDASAVPEPSALALMGLGLFSLGLLSRRKIKK
jgi:hypothetical protein